MYEARKLSNLLLAKFNARDFELTNLRMNKLLFFIHAEALLIRQDGLIRNHFEAWQYGPVIQSVFNEFKKYGDQWIREPALYMDYSSGQMTLVPFDDIASGDVDLICHHFLNYSRFTTGQLVSLSHEVNGPWDIAYRAYLANPTASPRIPNELIRAHFAGGRLSTTRH
jgi:uncharacterized phage-associated protein